MKFNIMPRKSEQSVKFIFMQLCLKKKNQNKGQIFI